MIRSVEKNWNEFPVYIGSTTLNLKLRFNLHKSSRRKYLRYLESGINLK
jgi:hypothetical protein